MSTHLAIVTPLPPVRSSIGQYGYYLSNALARTGRFTKITLLAQAAPDAHTVDRELPFQVERLWHLNRLDSSFRIVSRLRRLRPDLVWYNLGASIFGQSSLSNASGLMGPVLSKSAGIPTVVTQHELLAQANLPGLHVPGGAIGRWGANVIHSVFTQGDLVCVTLRRHAEYLSKNRPKLRVVHIPHGTFNSPVILSGSSELELLFLGYIAPFKGLELLLEVFNELNSQYPSLTLTIAGDNHPRFPEYLQQIQRAFGRHPAIRWLGYVPENKLCEVFRRATVVVLPRTATTGSSSVLYRAAGWGRPIVASDLPELRAIAEEERLWVEFFSTGDSNSLKATLESLLKDASKREAQIQHNYHIIRERLTLAHISQLYLQAFELVLRNAR
jgi:glycosyltransferase involved in cell wall biosynthesis